MAKPKNTTKGQGTKKKRKTPIAKLRHQVSSLAANANKLLADIRAESPEWLWERWDSYLYEFGTKRGNNFRRTTSRMNTEQLREYRELLYSFYNDMEEEKEMYRQYGDYFNESDRSFMFRMGKRAKEMYFRYYPPSEKEAEAFKNDVQSSIWARLHDKEYMETHDRMDIYRELEDAIAITGNIKDPKQGDTTKFRNIFTAPEFIYRGKKVRKRYL